MVLEGSKTYIEEMISMSDPSPDDTDEPSEITQFFAGRKVLVTGGSGFVGKLLVEKLLRSCPNIEKLYMLMRAKKNKSSEERFKEHFEDTIYCVLKKQQPNFHKKVVLVEGDTGLLDLGLSTESRKLLLDTEIIFHCAATVRFDEKLRVATYVNVRGTRQMLLLAKEMPNLQAFIHVSTAYSNCMMKLIDEKFYDPPMETEKLLSLVEIIDDEKMSKITPTLLGQFPNTYIFTKAVAEETVRRYSTGLPTCIVRPSIVIATADEPFPGWINNLYGPTGVVVGAGIGLLRSLYCIPENVADIIPADYVVANIITAAWETATVQRIPPSITDSEGIFEKPDVNDPPIYNVVSSCQKPITWYEFTKENEIYGLDTPSVMIVWYYMFSMNRYRYIHDISVILLHYLPAVIVDTLAILTGRKPMLFKAYRKIHKFSGVLAYFSTNQWRFKNDNVLKLMEKMSPVDRKQFNFDLSTLDWQDYFYNHIRGLRVYLIKDPLDTLEVAKRKYARLKVAHYTLITFFRILLVYWAYLFLGYIWSLCPLSY